MTRASLLRILDHVNGISDDEIRELEQLAAAFPYCQTAHVLLAKTAHDRGSMLAGQRLRRAATYATDRELLRQLLERPVAPITEPVPASARAQTPPAETAAPTAAAPVAPTVLAAAVLAEPVSAPETDLFAVEVVSATAPAADTPAEPEPLPLPVAPESAPDTEATPLTDDAAGQPISTESAVEEADSEAVETAALTPSATEMPADEATPAYQALEAGPDEQLAAAPVTTEAEATADEPVEEAPGEAADQGEDETTGEEAQEPAIAADASASTPVTAETADELLPAVAPPIRPPSGAGISRFEFGLGESRLPEPTGYRLPGIEEEDEDPVLEEDELPTFRTPPPPRITAPFRADAELGYALSGGSRLGYDLQARTSDGFTLDLPLEAFFEPDALLLAHARAHQPAPKPSSLDLINRFLKAQPRIKAGMAGVALPAAEQADLSVRSNAAAPALASESLAKIMVRQGKTAKAIEIYERLMAKQPEKMAYFAEQIQQLQQPPE
ncbi:hypothetical protein [Hymenobacter actinosclerus]|uniref:Uncharacterized protein n=1 Tax=Hymenobacter actinosclerus TaxID=82805 RepID=A0A1I0DKN6_9BACT|nr:hypothetical protein [Hymenobacter actinosclerus]SET33066.1 hypothetical protein SAMN04487998_1451 [Hymenobacter actinosclerus]